MYISGSPPLDFAQQEVQYHTSTCVCLHVSIPVCFDIVMAFLLLSLQKWQQEQHSGTTTARIDAVIPIIPISEPWSENNTTDLLSLFTCKPYVCVITFLCMEAELIFEKVSHMNIFCITFQYCLASN